MNFDLTPEQKEIQRAADIFAKFDESRVMVAAQALGVGQGAFDRAIDYAKKRQQFGQRLVDFHVTQHKLADMATQIAVIGKKG